MSRRAVAHVEWCERMKRKVSRKAVALRLKLHLSTVTQIISGRIRAHEDNAERRAMRKV